MILKWNWRKRLKKNDGAEKINKIKNNEDLGPWWLTIALIKMQKKIKTFLEIVLKLKNEMTPTKNLIIEIILMASGVFCRVHGSLHRGQGIEKSPSGTYIFGLFWFWFSSGTFLVWFWFGSAFSFDVDLVYFRYVLFWFEFWFVQIHFCIFNLFVMLLFLSSFLTLFCSNFNLYQEDFIIIILIILLFSYSLWLSVCCRLSW